MSSFCFILEDEVAHRLIKMVCLLTVLLYSCEVKKAKHEIPTWSQNSQTRTISDYLQKMEDGSDEWVIQLLKENLDDEGSHSNVDPLMIELIESHIDNVVICELGANYYLKNGKVSKANELNERARSLGAKTANFYKILALSSSKLGKFDLAIDYINRAIHINVNDPEMYTHKGEVYLAFGDTLSGIKYLENGFLLDPTKQEVGLKVAELYFDIDQIGKSEKWLLDNLKLDTLNEKYQFLLAEIYYSQGEEYKAINIFRNMLKTKNLKAGHILLYHFEERQQPDSIFVYANRILEIDSLNLKALNQKAWVFEKRGYFPSSLQYYQKVLAIDSLNQEALTGVAKVEGKIAYLRKIKEQRQTIPRIELAVPKKKVLINE